MMYGASSDNGFPAIERVSSSHLTLRNTNPRLLSLDLVAPSRRPFPLPIFSFVSAVLGRQILQGVCAQQCDTSFTS